MAHESGGEGGESALAARLRAVHARIDEACRDAGRSPDDVELVVVTKFHPPELVEALAELGERRFGENRHPEARDKRAAVGRDDLEWHFVGQVQTNKARQIAAYADCIQSIDRPGLVDALATARRERPLDVFVQVGLSDESGRGGVAPDALESLVEHVLATPVLRLRGLMTVAPQHVEPARAFARLAELSADVRRIAPGASALSMGMSGDFVSAISQGATHLRIGAAITGERPMRQ
ncbi:YggS family pyridoxal phosphate-dependent enzyme [Pseudoclavibacter chungangensis]|uniref:Pyridoxal phosphate homeostasis protein n=1 Tax=Pseudoclavibacter chungangensis TaxID=587635 RepID=A0A7J5BZN2_9MICO|nr:YggS family pyridoxal phosphate-dependent enzyme [Pseudoclavibacter chungangensis]KAB1660112.1 YggS family pyridoxal phosphate-dependent enzyme [Pseudoclavibacter chungangensis]NYJ66783.1 hypothetical protein [Pseudoclavibacter chungangensis]